MAVHEAQAPHQNFRIALPVLAERLRAAVDPTICLHALEALAGAVEGVRKSALPADRKAELKRWFNDVTRGIKTGV